MNECIRRLALALGQLAEAVARLWLVAGKMRDFEMIERFTLDVERLCYQYDVDTTDAGG